MVARISPVCTGLIIFGIIFLGALPPVGILLLVAALVAQKRYRGRVLRAQAERHARALGQHHREQAAAARYFS